MKVTDKWRQGSWHEYFCDQTCLFEYIRANLRNIVAIAPCTEAKETPITDPKKTTHTSESRWGNHSWTTTEFKKKEVDNA